MEVRTGRWLARGPDPSFLQRSRYRVGQFLNGWRATVSPQDYALVEQVLSPVSAEAMVLFTRMPVDAQAHSLRVLKTLRADGTSLGAVLPDLAVAALLHDVGKVAADDAGVYSGLWMRGPLVLLEAWRPDLLAWLASPHPSARPALRALRSQRTPADRRRLGRAGGL